jgi:hypothetical protein
LGVVSGGPGFNTAFLRFDWVNAFRAATGVKNAAQLVAASLVLSPDFGDSQTIQMRRSLQRWSDPASGGDFNSNPTGAPTWNSSAHGTKSWNQTGAGRLGSNGSSTNDYFGTNDLASRVDATMAMNSITEPTQVGGALVTDAFRFWFDNPAYDYGYALRLAAGSQQETKFARWESGVRAEGPVLKLTYLLPGATPRLDIQRTGTNVRVQWPIEYTNFFVEASATATGGWVNYDVPASTNSGFNFLDLSPGAEAQYFRLSKP